MALRHGDKPKTMAPGSREVEAGEDGRVEDLQVLEVPGKYGLEDIQVEGLVIVNGDMEEPCHLLHP